MHSTALTSLHIKGQLAKQASTTTSPKVWFYHQSCYRPKWDLFGLQKNTFNCSESSKPCYSV